jgi:hypothetical protein
MAMLDFPASPTVGQTYTVGNLTWVWDGAKWQMSATLSGPFLPLAGGTLTGPLVLAADPVVGPGAATKQYVDAQNVLQNNAVAALPVAINPNRIINGDMLINQRQSGPNTTTGYLIDCWKMNVPVTGILSYSQQFAGAGLIPLGYGYYASLVSTSAHVSAATDNIQIQQNIEADMISDFAWGTSNAQPITISFWVFSSLTGNFSARVANYNGTRSYPFIYNIPTASTWTKITVTIPGDTAGTWVMSGNVGAITFCFDLGSGANYRGTANAWASSNIVGVTGSVSLVATNNAFLYITGVKMEIGSVATPFNRDSLAKKMADCQRYYVGTDQFPIAAYQSAGSSLLWPYHFPVPMRTTPTTNGSITGGSGYGTGSITPNGNMTSTVTLNATGTGPVAANIFIVATAEL